MPEGKIKFLVTDKGFGFIRAADGVSEYFFHMRYLAPGHAFDALQAGDTVRFQLRQSVKKPGQQEAFDVEPTQGASTIPTVGAAPKLTAVRTTTPPVIQRDRASACATLPYGFVPVDLNRALTATPVLHDGSSGGDLLSGEILCELEALTPLLPGNARYAVSDARTQWGFQGLENDKQIAEPLRLPDGRVVIAGSALKGMIRHSLGALTSAPMERVGERHFTYRPNLDFNKSGIKERYVVRPALAVVEIDGGWDIEVFGDARAAVFVRGNANPPSESDYRCAIYKGGIDGEGLLAAASPMRTRTYPSAFVPKKVGIKLHLPVDLYRRYLHDQKEILSDQKTGHLKAHPSSSTHNFKADQIAAAICQHARWVPGQLIYVELTTDSQGKVTQESQVVSCGHHFRYRWAYTSSIRTHNNQPRACLTSLPSEQQHDTDGKPERLTGTRLLFGYVHDDKTLIGEGAFKRLAGRIAINHAVSDGIPEFLGNEDTGYCIPLKILGQPKPSAWEFYLQQPDDPKKPPNTYGDLPGLPGGELAGRKFYRHQPDTDRSHIEACAADEGKSGEKIHPVNTRLATLARFVCAPTTRFRFAIRFARLRDWELGALLAVLEPYRLASDGTPGKYAHKLGLGRPLGMGSVKITRKDIRIRREETSDFIEPSEWDHIAANALAALSPKLNDSAVKEWLEAHRYRDGQRLGYPLRESRDGPTIYSWHTNIRQKYSQLRRQEQPEPAWSDLVQEVLAYSAPPKETD